MHNFIISFGMPRSGTTLIQEMFMKGSGYHYMKLAEGVRLHPYHRNNGLIDLAGLYRLEQLSILRTTRHPVDIAASWQFLDPSITLDEIIERYNAESENFWKQAETLDKLSERIQLTYVSARFCDFGDEAQRFEILDRVSKFAPKENVHKWDSYMRSVWKKKPVRPGRLSNKRTDQVISDDWIETILKYCEKTIRREHLEETSEIIKEAKA